jgi:hypothetical protein
LRKGRPDERFYYHHPQDVHGLIATSGPEPKLSKAREMMLFREWENYRQFGNESAMNGKKYIKFADRFGPTLGHHS